MNVQLEPADVYVGRPSRWGNPYLPGRDGTREEVVELYRRWIKTRPELMKDVGTLHGRKLGCHCHPLPCHAEVLVELAAQAHDTEKK